MSRFAARELYDFTLVPVCPHIFIYKEECAVVDKEEYAVVGLQTVFQQPQVTFFPHTLQVCEVLSYTQWCI